MAADGWLAAHYAELRALHISAVVLSLSLFVLRGAQMLGGAARVEARAWRILPHAVDTVLLASAVLLALGSHQYPIANGWLTAKVIALGVYVVLGSLALRRGRTLARRRVAFVAALACAGFIVGTAVHHDPDPRHWVGLGSQR